MKKLIMVIVVVSALMFNFSALADNDGHGPAGPAPNSGDGVSDGSGMDGHNGNDSDDGHGPAPNSGDGVSDGSGMDGQNGNDGDDGASGK